MAHYKSDIVDINLNTGNIHRSFLSHAIGQKDDDADRFGIRAFRDGVPQDLSGASCQAWFLNSQGTTIALTSYGTVSGNKAYVTLPQACYDYDGPFTLAIKIVGGGVSSTVRIVDGMVDNINVGGAVTPTSSVPTYQEILAQFDEMVAATTAATDAAAAATTAIAETFDATQAYSAGKYVVYSGKLYCLTADHAANVTWANTSKVECKLADETTDINKRLGRQITIISGSFENGAWVSSYYSTVFPVYPGESFSIKAPSSYTSVIAGLKSFTNPPSVGDAADFSDFTGWTTMKSISGGSVLTGTFPSDVHYLFVYAGPTTAYSRLPVKIVLNGVDFMGNVFDAIQALSNEGNSSEAVRIERELQFHPYGIEPFQMSLFKKTANLFSDFCYHITEAYYRASTNSDLRPYPRASATPSWQGWLIRVKPRTTYAMGPLDFRLEFLKSDGSLDTRFEDISSSEPNIVTTGENSYWMCLTQAIDRVMSDWMMVEGDTYPSDYISGYPEWVNVPSETGTSKTIAFFGDSITAGVGATKLFHMYIQDKYHFRCLNYGFGGSGFYKNSASQDSGRIGFGNEGRGVPTTPENYFTPNNVIARLPEINASTTDGIVIFAGTNDWGNNVSVTNLRSGIESALEYCITNYTNIPVLVMTPVHRGGDTTPNTQGKTLREYNDIIIEECEKYGVPYVDMMTMSGLYPDNANSREAFYGDSIGLHPNADGHKRIASAMAEVLKSILMCHDFTD